MSVLQMLLTAFPGSVSGEEMARTFSLSRSAVWKQIRSLERQGLQISGKPNSGYRLTAWPDLLLPELLEHYRQATALGYPVHYRQTIDSTNLLAKDLARQGAPAGTLVVAEAQTAGRGRRGRGWLSPPGAGVFASLIIHPDLAAERIPLLTITIGIALVQAVQSLGLPDAWLKWPNDVWVGNRKLAGILAELSGQADHVDWVVAGIGVNTKQLDFPDELASKATSFLRETGQEVNRAELLTTTLRNLEDLLPLLEKPGIDPLLDKWRLHDRLTGRSVRVVAPGGSFIGQAIGITANGALIVRDQSDGSARIVLAGDVSLEVRLPEYCSPEEESTCKQSD